ncbi:MAG: AAA family ATPase [Clostridia bacterium]|nr:AAA family ATPase [Clostridia bacterium]
MYIPNRFAKVIDTHLLGNFLNIDRFPLILAIIGQPGMGKTYQLRNYLKAVGVTILSVNAADLESDCAGEPAKLLQQKYIEASSIIRTGQPAVLLIDDIDTTLGEWENYTGTVNHQDILAFLMHIADNPEFIENVGETTRVPIFFTGNDFDRLYKPLLREGRANRFDWEPTREEKINIVSSIFSFSNREIAEMLVDAYPTEKISYFSNLLVNKEMELLSDLSSNVVIKYILTDINYKEKLLSQYQKITKKIRWDVIAKDAVENSKNSNAEQLNA